MLYTSTVILGSQANNNNKKKIEAYIYWKIWCAGVTLNFKHFKLRQLKLFKFNLCQRKRQKQLMLSLPGTIII